MFVIKDDVGRQLTADAQGKASSAVLRIESQSLSYVFTFEREMMLERQREGVAKAEAAGKYKGRKPLAADHSQEVVSLAGGHGENRHCPPTKHRGGHRLSNPGGHLKAVFRRLIDISRF